MVSSSVNHVRRRPACQPQPRGGPHTGCLRRSDARVSHTLVWLIAARCAGCCAAHTLLPTQHLRVASSHASVQLAKDERPSCAGIYTSRAVAHSAVGRRGSRQGPLPLRAHRHSRSRQQRKRLHGACIVEGLIIILCGPCLSLPSRHVPRSRASQRPHKRRRRRNLREPPVHLLLAHETALVTNNCAPQHLLVCLRSLNRLEW